jgi:threonine dehydratase
VSPQGEKSSSVTLKDIKDTRDRISARIIRTPLVLSDAASDGAGVPVHLKLESLQRTGSFKVRGALSKATSLTSEERSRGLICASSGNHGLGVAHASACLGTRCIVVLPENPNPYKVSLLEKLGAEAIAFGATSDLQWERVNELSTEHGYTPVHPFADPMVIAGQGTVGLEVVEDLPEVDEVYVPIGGGGLISGIATAIKESLPHVRIYGVEPEHSDAMSEALRKGTPVGLTRVDTVADGLAARITGDVNLSIVRRYVDEVILVSDQEILSSTLFLLDHAKMLVEPSAAAALAGILANAKRQGRAVVIMSGGNITLQQLEELRESLRRRPGK